MHNLPYDGYTFLNEFIGISYSRPYVCLQILHARVSTAMFLFCDHVLLLHHNHLLQINTGKWSRLSIQCWLYSIVMNLVRDVYTLRDVLATYGRTQGQNRVSSTID